MQKSRDRIYTGASNASGEGGAPRAHSQASAQSPPSRDWVGPYFDFTTVKVEAVRISAKTAVKCAGQTKHTFAHQV